MTSTYGSSAVERERAGLAGPGWVAWGPLLGGASHCPVTRPEIVTDLQRGIREFLFNRKAGIGQTGLLGVVLLFFEACDLR